MRRHGKEIYKFLLSATILDQNVRLATLAEDPEGEMLYF
jgi:hypothetical protein